MAATLKLAGENAVTYVVEWFGKEAKIYKKNDELYADVTTNEQALIYWCLQYGESVELVTPTKTREEIKKIIDAMQKKYQ